MPAVNLGLPSAGAAIALVDGSSVSSEQAELAELHHLEMEAIHNGSVETRNSEQHLQHNLENLHAKPFTVRWAQ